MNVIGVSTFCRNLFVCEAIYNIFQLYSFHFFSMRNIDINHVGKYISISLVNGEMLHGFCYTIDPVTLSVILIVKDLHKSGKFITKLVTQHSVKDVMAINIPLDYQGKNFEHYLERLNDALKGNSMELGPSEIFKRKEKLCNWLNMNHLPVLERGDNILSVVNGVAMIEPPYTVESCRSSNTIVLDRVMKIVKSCPNL